jgi:hypothetical protein
MRSERDDAAEARAAWLAGARLFDAGDFFAAHEAWEARWRAAAGAERLRLQGLILAAAALMKRDRGVTRGAAGLWRRGRRKLELARAEAAPAPFDVAAFVAGMDEALAGAAGAPRLAPPLREDG